MWMLKQYCLIPNSILTFYKGSLFWRSLAWVVEAITHTNFDCIGLGLVLVNLGVWGPYLYPVDKGEFLFIFLTGSDWIENYINQCRFVYKMIIR